MCGSREEENILKRRRQKYFTRPCVICCEFLHVSPPPYNYLRNMKHKHSTLLRCNRCLHGMIPESASHLRQTCKHWRDLASGNRSCRVLFLVTKTLSNSSVTRRYPWQFSIILHELALFFGREFIQPCESRQSGGNLSNLLLFFGLLT